MQHDFELTKTRTKTGLSVIDGNIFPVETPHCDVSTRCDVSTKNCKLLIVNCALILTLLLSGSWNNVMGQSAYDVQVDGTQNLRTTNGEFVIPYGVTSVTIHGIGGGGGGSYSSDTKQSGGGGGGGAYDSYTFNVTPKTSANASTTNKITYTIGTGGSGGSGTNNGGNSTAYYKYDSGSTLVLQANGGKGCADNTTPGANGGSKNTTSGHTSIAGGYGAQGQGDGSASGKGGGGGGAAGPNTTPQYSNTTTGTKTGGTGYSWSGTSNTGQGGSGADGAGNGSDGNNYGGGGGGSRRYRITDPYNGGSGAQGVVWISYTIHKFKVVFNANGGTGSMEKQLFTCNEPQNLTSNSFTRIGYKFKGWSTSSSATTATWTNGASYSNSNTETDEFTLYAVWECDVQSGTLTISSNNNNFCYGGQTTLSASISGYPSNATLSNYQWSNGKTEASPTFVPPAGTNNYSLTATVSYGNCSGSKTSNTVTVTVKSLPNAPSVTSKAFCAGETVSLTASSGSDNVQCKWYSASSGGTLLYTGTTYTPSPTPTSTVSYYVEGYNTGTQCSSSSRSTITATINSLPSLSLTNGTQTKCDGQEIETITINTDVTSTGVDGLPNGLTKTGNNITGTPEVTGTYPVVTTYTVTATNTSTGCTKTAQGTITVTASPTVTITQPAPACEGTSFTLSKTVNENGATITSQEWQISASTTSSDYGTLTNSNIPYSYDQHYVRYKVKSSCGDIYSTAKQVTVYPATSQPAAISITAGSAEFCQGERVTLATSGCDADRGFYEWSGTDRVNSYISSKYTNNLFNFGVSGNDGNTVKIDSNTFVRYITGGDPQINMQSLLSGTDSFDLRGKSIRFKYRLISGTPGTVQVFFKTNVGLKEARSIKKDYKAADITPGWHVMTIPTNADGQPGHLEGAITATGWRFDLVSGAGVTMDIAYIALVGDGSVQLDKLTAGTHNITVKQSSYYGCVASSTQGITITTLALPSAPTVTNGSVCGSGTVSLSATPTGSGATTCKWYNDETGGTLLTTGTSFTTPSLTTTTTYYVSSYNGNKGCESESRTAVTATVNPVPEAVASVTSGERCGSGTVTLSATVGSNANTCRWYASQTGGDVLATALSYTTTSISTTKTYYVSSYNSETQCESQTRTAVVATVHPLPTISVTSTQPSCSNTSDGSIVVNATPATTPAATIAAYSKDGGTNWNASTENSYTYSGLANNSNYSIKAKDNFGCISAASSVSFDVQPITVSLAASPTTVCYGKNTTLTATKGGYVQEPVSYVWSHGLGTTESNTLTTSVVEDRTYEVTIVDSKNCSATASATVSLSSVFSPGAISSGVVIMSVGSTPATIASVQDAQGSSISYTWKKDGNTISGATGATYTPLASDYTGEAQHTYTRYAADNNTQCPVETTQSSGTYTLKSVNLNYTIALDANTVVYRIEAWGGGGGGGYSSGDGGRGGGGGGGYACLNPKSGDSYIKAIQSPCTLYVSNAKGGGVNEDGASSYVRKNDNSGTIYLQAYGGLSGSGDRTGGQGGKTDLEGYTPTTNNGGKGGGGYQGLFVNYGGGGGGAAGRNSVGSGGDNASSSGRGSGGSGGSGQLDNKTGNGGNGGTSGSSTANAGEEYGGGGGGQGGDGGSANSGARGVVKIYMASKPTATITTPNAICAGGDLDITPSINPGGPTEEAPLKQSDVASTWWVSSNGTNYTQRSNLNDIPFSMNNYYVKLKVVTIYGENFSNAVQITVNDIPTVAALSGTPAAICSGGNLDLTAPTVTDNGLSTEGNRKWQISSTEDFAEYEDPFSITNVQYAYNGGWVRYAATNACGMGYDSPVQITVHDKPSVANISSPAAICAGGTLSISAPSVNDHGTSSTSNRKWQISETQNGTFVEFQLTNVALSHNGHYIRYAATNDCGSGYSNAVPITVKDTAILVLASGSAALSHTICAGQSMQTIKLQSNKELSFTELPAGITTSRDGQITTISGTPAATFSFTATNDLNNCNVKSLSGTITVNDPQVSLKSFEEVTVCEGQGTTLQAELEGSHTGNITYQWKKSGSIISGETSSTLTVTPESTTSYSVIATATVGSCTKTDEEGVTVTVTIPTISLNTIEDKSICLQQSVTLTASVQNPSEALTYTYEWSPSTGLSSTTGESVTASPTETTTYRVIGTATAGSCFKKDTTFVKVTVNPLPTLSLSSNATQDVCSGVDMQAVSITTDGTPSLTGGTGTMAISGSSLTGKPNANGTYTITATSAFGCTSTAQGTITMIAKPTITITSIAAICEGNHFALPEPQINTNGSALTGSGLWQISEGTSSEGNYIALNNHEIPYSYDQHYVRYTATNSCGPGYSNPQQVTVYATPTTGTPTITITEGSSKFCYGGDVELTATSTTHEAAGAYIWAGADLGDGSFFEDFHYTDATWPSSYTISNGTVTGGVRQTATKSFNADGNVVLATGNCNGVVNTSDPMISMYEVGSFDPSVYKYFQIKYRTLNDVHPGNVEIFFVNGPREEATGGYSLSKTYSHDGQWHTMTIDASTHASWNDGPITGWRFDFVTRCGTEIEIAYFALLKEGNPLSVTKPEGGTHNYYVTQVSNHGCGVSGTAEQVIVVDSLPALPTASNQGRCNAGTVTLSATPGARGTTCIWYDSDYTALDTADTYVTPSLSTTTTYYVSSYNSTTGCESEDKVEVKAVISTAPNEPASVTGKSRCGDGEVTLKATADSENNVCRWFNASDEYMGEGSSYNTGTLTAGANYTYKVYSYNYTTQCYSNTYKEAVATISAYPTINSVEATQPACFNTKGSISIDATAGAPATSMTYSITSGNYEISPVFENLYGTYEVVVRNQYGCTTSYDGNPIVLKKDTIKLTSITSSNGLVLCNGGSTSLTASSLNVQGTPVYSWTCGATDLGVGNPMAVNVPAPSTTTYNVKVTDEKGCTATNSISITAYKNFSAGAIASGNVQVKKNDPVGEIGSEAGASGGDGNYSYQWYKDGVAISGATNATYNPGTTYSGIAGTYVFTRKAKDNTCQTTLEPSSGQYTVIIYDNIYTIQLDSSMVVTRIECWGGGGGGYSGERGSGGGGGGYGGITPPDNAYYFPYTTISYNAVLTVTSGLKGEVNGDGGESSVKIGTLNLVTAYGGKAGTAYNSTVGQGGAEGTSGLAENLRTLAKFKGGNGGAGGGSSNRYRGGGGGGAAGNMGAGGAGGNASSSVASGGSGGTKGTGNTDNQAGDGGKGSGDSDGSSEGDAEAGKIYGGGGGGYGYARSSQYTAKAGAEGIAKVYLATVPSASIVEPHAICAGGVLDVSNNISWGDGTVTQTKLWQFSANASFGSIAYSTDNLTTFNVPVDYDGYSLRLLVTTEYGTRSSNVVTISVKTKTTPELPSFSEEYCADNTQLTLPTTATNKDGVNDGFITGTWNSNPITLTNDKDHDSILVATFTPDLQFCANSKTYNLTIYGKPNIAAISKPDSICVGQTLTIDTPTVTSSMSVTSQGWQLSNNTSSSGDYHSININDSRTYEENGHYLRYIATNSCSTSYNSCTKTNVSNAEKIIVKKEPEIATLGDIPAICANSALPVSAPTVTANGNKYTGEWRVSNSETGTYTTFTDYTQIGAEYNGKWVKYYIEYFCNSKYSNAKQLVVHELPAAPELTAVTREPDTFIVCGNGSSNITLTANPGTGNTCRWYDANSIVKHDGNSYQINSLSAGIYDYLVTAVNDATHCESADSTAAVAVIGVTPSITAVSKTNMSCHDTVDGKITVTANYISPATSLLYTRNNWGQAPSNGEFKQLSAGTYTIKVKDNFGCEKVLDSTVTIKNPEQLTVSLSASSYYVCESESVTLTATATNAQGAVTYTWKNGSTQLGDPTSTNTKTDTPTATSNSYNVYIKDSHSCTATATASTVTMYPKVSMNTPANQYLCHNDKTTTITFAPASALASGESVQYKWTRSENSNITWDPELGTSSSGYVTSIGEYTVSNNSTTAQVVTVTVTPYYTNANVSNCEGNPITYTYTVYPHVVMEDLSSNTQTLCHGSSLSTISLSSSITDANAVTYSWTRDNTDNVTGIANSCTSGCTSISASSVSNTTNTAQATVFTVSPKYTSQDGQSKSCPVIADADKRQFTITVNPETKLTAKHNKNVVSHDSLLTLKLSTSITDGERTFHWSRDNSNVTGWAMSGTEDTLALYPENETATAQIVHVKAWLSYTNGGKTCTTPVDTVKFNITVNPRIRMDKPSDQYICHSSKTTANTFTCPDLTLSGGASVKYKWTRSGNTNISWNPTLATSSDNSTGIGQYTVSNTTSTAQKETVTVTPYYTNNGITDCKGEPVTYTYTVYPHVVMDDLSANTQKLCHGSAFSTANNFSTTITDANAVTYTWTRTNTGATGVTGVDDGCTSGCTSISSTGLSNVTNSAQATTFTVMPTYTSIDGQSTVCPALDADKRQFTLTVYPQVVVNNPGQQYVSNDSTLTVNLTSSISDGTISYIWSRSTVSGITGTENGSGESLSTPIEMTLKNTNTTATTTIVTVTPTYKNTTTNETCTGTPFSFNVTVHPRIQIDPITDRVMGHDSIIKVAFTHSEISGGTLKYRWRRTTETNVGGMGTASTSDTDIDTPLEIHLTNTNTSSKNITFTITPVFSNNGIDNIVGESKTFVVTVNPHITMAASPKGAIACSGTSYGTISFSTPLDVTSSGASIKYKWTRTNATNVTGMDASGESTSISAILSTTQTSQQTTHFTVTPWYTANGLECAGDTIQFDIKLKVAPTVSITQPEAICEGNTISSTETINDHGGTLSVSKWQKKHNDTWSDFNLSTPLSYENNGDKLRYVVENECGTDNDEKTITIYQLPATPTISGEGLICSPTSIELTASSTNPDAGSFVWSGEDVAANTAYFEGFSGTSYTYNHSGQSSLTPNTPTSGQAQVHSDKTYEMQLCLYEKGQFSPDDYQYVQLRYKTVSTSAASGKLRVFFCNMTNNKHAYGGHSMSQSYMPDGQWHVMTFHGPSENGNWLNDEAYGSGRYITGLRLDVVGTQSVDMIFDYIAILKDTNKLVVENPSVGSHTYYVAQVSPNGCGASEAASKTVEVKDLEPGAITNGSMESYLCGSFTISNVTAAKCTSEDDIDYKWTCNGTDIPNTNLSSISEAQYPLHTAGTFEFKRWARTTCTACTESTWGEATGSYTITVKHTNPGSIARSASNIYPCQDFSITNSASAECLAGQTPVYQWSYTKNGSTATLIDVPNTTKAITQANLPLNEPGVYVITRSAKTTCTEEEWQPTSVTITVDTVHVNPGSISTVQTTQKRVCAYNDYSISSITAAQSLVAGQDLHYKWVCLRILDGDTVEYKSELFNAWSEASLVVEAANNPEYLIEETGLYIIQRYAWAGCDQSGMEAASNQYRVQVIAPNQAIENALESNYYEICSGGKVFLTSNNDLATVTVPDYDNPTTNISLERFSTIFIYSYDDGSYDEYINGVTELTVDWGSQAYLKAKYDYPQVTGCYAYSEAEIVQIKWDPYFSTSTIVSPSTPICPNQVVTITAPELVSYITPGTDQPYYYTWLTSDGSWTYDTVSSEAYYSYEENGKIVHITNSLRVGQLSYGVITENALGCNIVYPAYATIQIENAEPIVLTSTESRKYCPSNTGEEVSFATTIAQSYGTIKWYSDSLSQTALTEVPKALLAAEGIFVYYVSQDTLNCESARIPDTIEVRYTSHIAHNSGTLIQELPQKSRFTPSPIEAITFDYSNYYAEGNAVPVVTGLPQGVSGVANNGVFTISGEPTQAGTFNYTVRLQGGECPQDTVFEGKLTVYPTYDTTVYFASCNNETYTVSDKQGHSYTVTTVGTHYFGCGIVNPLKTVHGVDSTVTVVFTEHNWNQFGFEDTTTLIAGWSSFNSVASPIAADCSGSVSGSQITYNASDWNGNAEVTQGDNVNSEFALCNTGNYSLALPQRRGGTWHAAGYSDCTPNDGSTIVIKTSTAGFGELSLSYGYQTEVSEYSISIDASLRNISYEYSIDGTQWVTMVSTSNLDYASGKKQGYVNIDNLPVSMNNRDAIYIRFTFAGAGVARYSTNYYLLLDNICISGKKGIHDVSLDKHKDTVCRGEYITLYAPEPYIDCTNEPCDTAAITYNWTKIVSGNTLTLSEHGNILLDQVTANTTYEVSVGSGSCASFDQCVVTMNEPIDSSGVIIRHQTECANNLSSFVFVDEMTGEPVIGAHILSPAIEDMQTPGEYDCRLSIPIDPDIACDSIITLKLTVLKSYDTTIVASICLGESYTDFGFNITPTETGITYYRNEGTCTTDCDSIVNLTLETRSVKQTLTSIEDELLAAWPLDKGNQRIVPSCGVKSASARLTLGSSNGYSALTVDGKTVAGTLCYYDETSKAIQLANGFCAALGSPWQSYDGTYFEMMVLPREYSNLQLTFDYMKSIDDAHSSYTNINNAFNTMTCYYKFGKNTSYPTTGSSISLSGGGSWTSAQFDLSSVQTIDKDTVYLKFVLSGGNEGSGRTTFVGTRRRTQYYSAYFTIDNFVLTGDKPTQYFLSESAVEGETEFCEGGTATFVAQTDPAMYVSTADTFYFKYFDFYLTNDVNSSYREQFTSNKMTITPPYPANYSVVAYDRTVGCDSIVGTYRIQLNETAHIAEDVTKFPDHIIDAPTTCSGVHFAFVPTDSVHGKVPPTTKYSWETPGNSTIEGIRVVDSVSVHEKEDSIRCLIYNENADRQPVTVNFTVTPWVGDCPGNPFKVRLKVFPAVTLDLYEYDGVESACPGEQDLLYVVDLYDVSADTYKIQWEFYTDTTVNVFEEVAWYDEYYISLPDICDTSYNVKVTYADYASCAISKSVTISAVDDEAPTLEETWPDDITGQDNCFANADRSVFISDEDVVALFSDNCYGAITATSEDTDNPTSDCGWTITRTYTIKDACGNIYYTDGTSTLPTQKLSGSDQTKPTFTRPKDTVLYVTNIPVKSTDTTTSALGVPTSVEDNCSATANITVTHRDSIVSVCGHAEKVYRIWRVVDACGNVSVSDSIQFINVLDTVTLTVTGDTSQIKCYHASIEDVVFGGQWTSLTINPSTLPTNLQFTSSYVDATGAGTGKLSGARTNAGTLKYTVTATNPCDVNTATRSAMTHKSMTGTITHLDTLIMTVIVDSAECSDHNGTIMASATGGLKPYKFYLDSDTSGKYPGVFNNVSEGSHTVTLADSLNCPYNSLDGKVNIKQLNVADIKGVTRYGEVTDFDRDRNMVTRTGELDTLPGITQYGEVIEHDRAMANLTASATGNTIKVSVDITKVADAHTLEFQCSTDSTFATNVYTKKLTDLSVTTFSHDFPHLTAGTYYVRAILRTCHSETIQVMTGSVVVSD